MAGLRTLAPGECISAHYVNLLTSLSLDLYSCYPTMKLEIVQLFAYDYPKMPQDERTRLLEKKAKLDARLKQLALHEAKQNRKDDTRRKIIAGALILEHAEIDPEFAPVLAKLLNRYVTRPQDRALFHVLDDRQPDPRPLPSDSPSNSFRAAASPAPPPETSSDAAAPASDEFRSAAAPPSPPIPSSPPGPDAP